MMMTSEPVGEIINLLTMKCQVFIPFECKRCGKCCREIGVGFAPLDIQRAANFLKINSKDFINRYLGEIIEIEDNGIHWKETKPRQPCPMLREENVCKIYIERPGPCRSFPISTDAGDSGIGCPGKLEMIKIRKVLGRGVPYYTSPVSRNEISKIKKPSLKQWRRILIKFLSSNPSSEVTKKFIETNKPQ